MSRPLTEAQKRLIALDLKKESVDKFYEDLDAAIREVQAEVGTDGFFQAEDGIVYKVIVPAGRYVKYADLAYVRTKRPDERAGTLSVKEAQENGFKI